MQLQTDYNPVTKLLHSLSGKVVRCYRQYPIIVFIIIPAAVHLYYLFGHGVLGFDFLLIKRFVPFLCSR
jgi:hypothetical protein